MNWDELRNVWERQPVSPLKLPEWSRCEREFVARQRQAERGLFWRDLREAGAGFFFAATLAYVGWHMGRAGWPLSLAVLLVLGLSGFFIRERVRTRREQPPIDAPLLTRLDAAIAELERQRHLLTHIKSWYLAPVLLAGAIFGATVLLNAPLPTLPLILVAGFMAAILGLCSWLVIVINRRAVRLSIEPRLHELREWRAVLSGER